jgi:hypothetical protein
MTPELEAAFADRIVNLLNELIKLDQDAISNLVSARVACNEAMSNHPTVQVWSHGYGEFTIGLMGLLNGLVPTRPDGYGQIAVDMDTGDGTVFRARRIE